VAPKAAKASDGRIANPTTGPRTAATQTDAAITAIVLRRETTTKDASGSEIAAGIVARSGTRGRGTGIKIATETMTGTMVATPKSLDALMPEKEANMTERRRPKRKKRTRKPPPSLQVRN
jgi:hypothetical protein